LYVFFKFVSFCFFLSGFGPIGLETAVSLVRKGYDVTVYEKGAGLASNMVTWEDVTLFSPNHLNYSKTGLDILRDMRIDLPPANEFSTGRQFIDSYLQPLESYLLNSGKCSISYNANVVSIGRQGLTKNSCIGDKNARSCKKFIILVSRPTQNNSEEESYNYFDIVFDATGTYNNPNFAGPGGIPAIGELKLRRESKISYYIADKVGSATATATAPSRRQVFVVLGSGTSAITTLKRLVGPDCKVVWITRCRAGDLPYAVMSDDPLPQRNELFVFGNSLVQNYQSPTESFEYRCDVDVSRFREVVSPDGATRIEITLSRRASIDACVSTIRSSENVLLPSPEPKVEVVEVVEEAVVMDTIYADKVYANIGYRPDLHLARELQVHYCWATEGPMKLAAALLSASGAGSGGDCLTQVSQGVETLISPEPNFFIVGMKSYGRGNAFLMRIGYEQVQSVVALLEQESLDTSATATAAAATAGGGAGDLDSDAVRMGYV
jgi:hypothetical protein